MSLLINQTNPFSPLFSLINNMSKYLQYKSTTQIITNTVSHLEHPKVA